MKMLQAALNVLIGCCIVYMVYLALNPTPKNAPGDKLPPNKTGNVNSIVSICKPAPFIIMGLDASDKRLVGVNPETKTAMLSNVLNKYFPHFQQISGAVCNNAFKPNIEELIRLKPDLIIQWKRLADEIAQMEHFGFNVLPLRYDGSEQGDRAIVQLLAGASGKSKRADSMMKLRDSVFKQIQITVENIPVDKRPKVIFVYDYGNWRVGGEKCYEHFCIEACGGKNMGKGLGVERSVNIEQILVWNPDIILLAGWRKNMLPEDIYRNPILQQVSAVKRKQVIKMPVWASNESPLIWMWAANVIQPTYFHIDIREEIKKSYKWQYGISLTKTDVDRVLFCGENVRCHLFSQCWQQ